MNKVSITAGFGGTTPSKIGSGNWLAAGMFLEGMDHVVGGEDYAYYDVIVLDNQGNLYLDVGAWAENDAFLTKGAQIINSLSLVFDRCWLIGGLSYQNSITLNMGWDPQATFQNAMLWWSVTINGQIINPPSNSFNMSGFNTGYGLSQPIPLFYVGQHQWDWGQPFVLQCSFFQFGIMSPDPTPLEQTGWQVTLSYPKYANTSSSPWQDVVTAFSADGYNSFLDACWLWGEQLFPSVDISSACGNYNTLNPLEPNGVLVFYYDSAMNGNSFPDSNPLWYPGTGGGGGCPYVYDWNGSGFAKDNNILPASENGKGTDTKDYYRLEQPLVPVVSTPQTSLYSLQIREFEREQDYIDQVKLLAVDHSQGTSIAVTPEGEIVTYQSLALPFSCVDSHGRSRLAETGKMDGNVSDPSTYFQGYSGDWLVLDFGRVAAANAKLILRDDQKCADICIDVQVPTANGGWLTVEVLHPRDFWAMEAVNMSAYVPANGNFVVRLLWTAAHRLDYVGLDTSSPVHMTVSSASPLVAIHSTLGDVTTQLRYDDENCVRLVNGQQITLTFRLPNTAQRTTRDFILYTDGYYYTIT